MKLRRSTALGSTASLLLASVGVVAFYLTPPNFDAQFRAAIDAVRTMHQTAAGWAVETSRVRADPSANFDGLSAFVPRVLDLRQTFSETMAALPASQQVSADGRAYVGALNAIAERVERFKTAYSAIRNSERYIPLASEALIEQARDLGHEPLAQEIRSITAAIAAFVAAPADADVPRLLARIQSLTGTARPDAMDERLKSYVAHARVVLDERERLQAHLDAITSSEFLQRAAPLSAALEMEQIAHHNEISLYQQGVLAAGVGIVLVWVIVGFVRRYPRPASSEPAPAPVREGGDGMHLLAAGAAETRLPDIGRPPALIDAMIACGVLPGLMGQTFAARAHRLLSDLESVCPEGAVAPEWARMRRDARLLCVYAKRMIVLGRHLAPKCLTDVDVNTVLTERLAGRAVAPECRLRPVPRIEAPRAEVNLLVDACAEWSSYCVRGLASHDVKHTVTTCPHEAGVEFAFTHNGGWLPPEHGYAAFEPFVISQSPRTGLAMPAVRYLARRLGGTASLAAPSDGQCTLTVRLPARRGA